MHLQGTQLDHLVRVLPERLRLVLVSRAAPRLRLARRSAEGAVVELHGRDLLFTAEETSQVLGRAAEDPLTTTVQDSTGGWPVAVGFVAHLHQLDDQSAVPTRWRSRSRKHVADFLAQEVLWEQPVDVQDFLLETSILDEITVASANAIRSSTDAGTHLDYLGRNDVFLTLLDGTDVDTWGHHALVRDHLQGALERNQPDRWGHLHRLAAAYFATRDEDRAIHHALAAPDAPLAADLIERGMDDPSFHHRVSRVQLLRLLDALPDHVLIEHKKLRTAGLGLAATHRRPDLVHRWLAALPAGAQDRLEELFAQSWQANIDGDMPVLQAACRQALSLCEPGSPWWLTTHSGLTEGEFMMGSWLACAESFSALRLPVLAPPVRVTAGGQEAVRAFLPVIWCRAGDPVAAGRALVELRDWLALVERQGYRSLGYAAWAQAMVALDAGDLAGATAWERLPEESVLKDQRLFRLAMSLDQARVRRAAGDDDDARRLLAGVRRDLQGMRDPGTFATWVAAEEAALGVRTQRGSAGQVPHREVPSSGAQQLTSRELEVLRLLRSEFTLPEIASHLFVSYNTAKSHRRTIYAKFGVGTRSAAVKRGRALGYL